MSAVSSRERESNRLRKLGYRGVCVDCGGPTNGSAGPGKAPARCAHCAPSHNRLWKPQAIIEAMRRWARLHGSPPTARQWLDRSVGRGYPGVGAVQREFGSWNAGIAAAGFAPVKQGGRRRGNLRHVRGDAP